ncbi:MAG TPA: site-2 protease family protein [Candidatus Dormibacteraeota bacterium]|nr:site-2 protease family protein [Candidatus Dormibacteraeota bacterium]
MSQNDPQRYEYLPPPPPTPPQSWGGGAAGGGAQYQGQSDIPPQSPYHYSATPRQRNSGGLVGWLGSGALALWAVVKYGLIFLVKLPAGATILSMLLSFGGYALLFGPWFAVALIVMIFVHEMGHVLEIRRQGMHATAPIFIPFLGAAIFQRSHPTDALKQAQIGIAGPIAGTLGATAAFLLYGSTGQPVFLLMAWIGFYVNLFNLIPIWQLDGAWILGPVSPYFQVVALAIVGVGALALNFFVSPLLIVFALLGIPSLIARFRNANNPYYTSVPVMGRLTMGFAWVGLVLYLGIMSLQAHSLMTAIAR